MNAKPVNYTTNHLIAPFFLTCVLLAGFGLVGLMHYMAILEPDGVLAKTFECCALDRYFAGILPRSPRLGFLAWSLNFGPFALIVGLVTVFLVVKTYQFVRPAAEKILLSSNEFDLIHRGVDMPPINHLENILFLCPDPDARTLLGDLYQSEIHPEAPSSCATDILDAPLTGYGDPARNKKPPSLKKS